jgi:hypothetical protein
MRIFARYNKKGSLELSVNAIVVIVLAMTLLGLGLGFVRNQFAKIGDTTGSVQEQIKQQILDDLRTGNKKLSFPATELKLESNAQEVVAIGIKNTEDQTLSFGISIYDLSKPDEGDTACEAIIQPATKAASANCGGFFWDYSVQTLGVGESNVFGLKFFAPRKKGTYLYKVAVEKATADGTPTQEIFAEKTFFANIV